MAISLLLPVVSTSQPNLFEIAIRMLPRMRAWTFSSATFGCVPSNMPPSVESMALKTGSMEMTWYSMPRFWASTRASSSLSDAL